MQRKHHHRRPSSPLDFLNRGCCGCGVGCLTGAVGLVLLCGLVCVVGIAWLATNAPEPPQINFTPSQSLASNLEHKVGTAAAGINYSQNFTLSFTEAEVASWMNLGVAAFNSSGIPMDNIQVKFTNGQATLYSDASVLGQDVGMLASFVARPGTDGKVEIEVTDLNFGGVSIPQSGRDLLSDRIQSALDDELGQLGDTYRLTYIAITDGYIRIQGTVN